jgi:YVTN family beta-propeller protein
VIDLASRRVVATLPIGQRPNRVTFTPDGKHVLIPIASGEVNVFDAATRQNIRKVQTGATPGGIVPSPDGKRVFVACGDANEIHVIDTERWTVAARIAVGRGPDGVAYKAR